MADLDKFQAGVSEVLFGSYSDSQFAAIRAVCGGMSGVKTAKLLNFAVSCLGKDEFYLEIGVYTGFTMISAGLGHQRSIIGVDNSSEFGDVRERFHRNTGMFVHYGYQYIATDFRNVQLSPANEKKTGVLYIDGKHDYKDLMDSLAWAENGILSDKSIIVIDDIGVKGISEGIEDWLKSHQDYKTIFYLRPNFDGSTGHDFSIGLGLAVLKKEKVINV